MTNRGLRFNTSLLYPAYIGMTLDFLDINFIDFRCLIDDKPQGIFLQIMSDFYVRVLSDSWIIISSLMRRSSSRTIYIHRDVDSDIEHAYNTDLEFGVKIYIKSYIDSQFLEIIDAWPLGFFDRTESTFLASELDSFTGFAKLAIIDTTKPIDKRRRIVDFILVVFNLESFSAYILNREHAKKFETFARSTSDMDYITATNELRKYRHTISLEYMKSEITVTDSLTNMLFRISAKRITKRGQVGWGVLERKAVKVELSLQ